MSFEQKQIFKFYIGYDDIFNDIKNLSNIKSQSNIAFDVLKYDDNNYEINIALAGITPNQVKIQHILCLFSRTCSVVFLRFRHTLNM